MQKFLIIFLCSVACAASGSVKPMGVVAPITRCGGVGTFIQLRVSDCDGFCYLQPGHKYDIEADIIPSSASPSLTLQVLVRVFLTDITVVDTILANSSVQPGQIYTVNFAITPNDVLAGQIVVITSNLLHTDSSILEICVQHNVSINYVD